MRADRDYANYGPSTKPIDAIDQMRMNANQNQTSPRPPLGIPSNSVASKTTVYQPVHSFSEPQMAIQFGKKLHDEKDFKQSVNHLDTQRSEGAVLLRDERLALLKVPRKPVEFQCPYCSYSGVTTVDKVRGECTCISSFLLGIVCFPCGYFIPYWVDGWKDVHHYCQHCQRLVGVNKPC